MPRKIEIEGADIYIKYLKKKQNIKPVGKKANNIVAIIDIAIISIFFIFEILQFIKKNISLVIRKNDQPKFQMPIVPSFPDSFKLA